MAQPTSDAVRAAQRVLIYIARTSTLGITYGGGAAEHGLVVSGMRASEGEAGKRGEADNTHGSLMGISDASWEVGPSVSGQLVMFNHAALAWTSRKQASTSLSSTEAEIFAAASAAAEVLWIKGLLGELGVAHPHATTLFSDNQGCVSIANDARSLGRSRHIARRARFLLEAKLSGSLRLAHLKGESMPADALTKPLERKRFAALRNYIMNEASSECSSSGECERRDATKSIPNLTSINEHSMPSLAGSKKSEIASECADGEAAYMSTHKTVQSGTCEMLGTWGCRSEHEGVSEPDYSRLTRA